MAASCSGQEHTEPPAHVRLTHGARIHAVAEAAQHRLLIGGSRDGCLVRWRLDADSVAPAICAHDEAITALAVSPNDDLLVSGCRGGFVKMWRLPGCQPVWAERIHGDVVSALCFAPDGSVVSASHDTTIRVVDAANGKELRRMGHEAQVYSAVFARAGSLLLTGGDDRHLRAWDWRTGEAKSAREGAGNAFHAIAVVGDDLVVAAGPRLALCSLDPRVAEQVLCKRERCGWLACVTAWPDGTRVASGGEDGVVRVWRVADGSEERTLRGHAGAVSDVLLLSRADHLAASDDEGVLLHRL